MTGFFYYDRRGLRLKSWRRYIRLKAPNLDCEGLHKIDTTKTRLIYFLMVLYISLMIATCSG